MQAEDGNPGTAKSKSEPKAAKSLSESKSKQANIEIIKKMLQINSTNNGNQAYFRPVKVN